MNTQIQLTHNTNLCPHFAEFFWKTALLILDLGRGVYLAHGRSFLKPQRQIWGILEGVSSLGV